MKPLCIDLFCGLGGWGEGFLAEGYDVIGFDIERHDYGTGGYPGQLVIQDVRTLCGSQFRDAAVIVASPPCQKYSYMAMPWTRAKMMANEIRASQQKWAELNELFVECFRIAHEVGIPLIVENVKGAEPWVGRARWHFGSFYLWGDLPALMPFARAVKAPGMNWSDQTKRGQDFTRCAAAGGYGNANHKKNKDIQEHSGNLLACFESEAEQEMVLSDLAGGYKRPAMDSQGLKLPGNNGPRRWADQEVQRLCDATKNIPHKPTGHWTNPKENGTKFGGDWWHDATNNLIRKASSRSDSRKAASAHIAKIPFPLANWIAKCFKPQCAEHSPMGES